MALRKTQSQISKLLDQTHDAAQTDIPAGAIRDQVRGRVLPPATPSSKGGVTISDADPQPLGTADPGSGAAVSSGGHVHAHGDLAGGSLHAVATDSVAGFMSAADKAKEDLYPAITGLTPGDVLTVITSSTIGFAPPSGGGGLPPGSTGDMFYIDNTGAVVLLEMAGVPLGAAIYATDVGGDQIPFWDIQPPRGGAGGDLGSTYPDPLVTGLQGFPISTTDPVLGDTLVFDGTFYTPTAAGTGTVTSVDITAPAAGITFAGGPITASGAITAALANDLAALEALSSTGIGVRSAADTWVQRSIVGTANRIGLTNGDGVSGNPTIDIAATYVGQTSITTLGTVTTGTWSASNLSESQIAGLVSDLSALASGIAASQPLDGDLTALAALGSTGLAVRTAANTWAQRTITGTASRLSVTNGDGVSGNPTLNIDTGYVGQSSITTLGTIGTGTWQGTKVGLTYGGTNADLSASGGAGQYLKQASAGGAIGVGTIPATDLTYSGLTTGQIFQATGASAAGFAALNLATAASITGILPAGNGGTGISNAGKLTLATDAAITGGGTLALGGFTLTAPATGTAALITTGTFTPTLIGSTIAGTFTYDATNTKGEWTRIGDRVFVNLRVRITAIGTAPTGNLQIGTLPITSGTSGAGATGALTGQWAGVTIPAGYTAVFGSVIDAATVINIQRSGSNQAAANVQGSELVLVGGAAQFVFSGLYRA